MNRVALALLAALAAQPAAARTLGPAFTTATMHRLTWTTPDFGTRGTLVGYVFECGNSRVAWRPINVYRDWSAGTRPGITPRAANARDTAYVSITLDPNNELGWRNGGARIRLHPLMQHWLGMDSVVDTLRESNEVLVAYGLPDTLCTDEGLTFKRPAAGIVTFARDVTNPTAPGPDGAGPLYSQEAWQSLCAATICAMKYVDGRPVFTGWGLRGELVPCAAGVTGVK